jgi:hypothetical protein
MVDGWWLMVSNRRFGMEAGGQAYRPGAEGRQCRTPPTTRDTDTGSQRYMSGTQMYCKLPARYVRGKAKQPGGYIRIHMYVQLDRHIRNRYTARWMYHGYT